MMAVNKGYLWQLSCTYSPYSGIILSTVCMLRVLLMTEIFGLFPLFDDLIPWMSLCDIVTVLVNAVVISVGVMLFIVTLLPFSILLTSGMWNRLFDRATYVGYKTLLVLFLTVCSAIHCGWLFYLCRTMWVKDYWIGIQVLQVLPLLILFGSTITGSLFVLVNQPHHLITITKQQDVNKGTVVHQLTSQWIYHCIPLVIYFFSMVYVAYTCGNAWDLELPYKAVIVTSSMVDVINHVYTAKAIYDIGKYLDQSYSVECTEKDVDFNPERNERVISMMKSCSGELSNEHQSSLCVLKYSVRTDFGNGDELVACGMITVKN